MSTLTMIFVVLKLTGLISWSWWLVLLPSLIDIILYLLFISGVFTYSFVATLKGLIKK
jgi:hypothetical protein